MTSNIAKYLNEEDIIKALVQNREKIATFIDELKPDYFNANDLKIIFKVIKTYFVKYKNPPKKNILISLLNTLSNSKTPPTTNTFQMVENIYETYEFTEFLLKPECIAMLWLKVLTKLTIQRVLKK